MTLTKTENIFEYNNSTQSSINPFTAVYYSFNSDGNYNTYNVYEHIIQLNIWLL